MLAPSLAAAYGPRHSSGSIHASRCRVPTEESAPCSRRSRAPTASAAATCSVSAPSRVRGSDSPLPGDLPPLGPTSAPSPPASPPAAPAGGRSNCHKVRQARRMRAACPDVWEGGSASSERTRPSAPPSTKRRRLATWRASSAPSASKVSAKTAPAPASAVSDPSSRTMPSAMVSRLSKPPWKARMFASSGGAVGTTSLIRCRASFRTISRSSSSRASTLPAAAGACSSASCVLSARVASNCRRSASP
mmetsp:Transcript_14501/g.42737  ORF Transcript_14501/g.42737 Transcript_14501/m.42737 type:complete len:248 (-) Transcript_14501:414-1157(-)